MILKPNHRGFSLVEVMVAAAIFSIAVVGIYASLASLKEQSRDVSDEGLGAALCAQQFLESKRAAVDMRDWNVAGAQIATTAGSTNAPSCTQTIGATTTTYQLNYQIVNDGPARKATVTVSWP